MDFIKIIERAIAEPLGEGLEDYCRLTDDLLSFIDKFDLFQKLFLENKALENYFSGVEKALEPAKSLLKRINNSQYYELLGDKRYKEEQKEWLKRVSLIKKLFSTYLKY